MNDTGASSVCSLASYLQTPTLTRIENHESLGRIVVVSTDAEKGSRIIREKPVIVWTADDWADFFSKFRRLEQCDQDDILDMFHPPFSTPPMMALEREAFAIARRISMEPSKVLKILAICNTNAHEYYGNRNQVYFEDLSANGRRTGSGKSALFLYASKVAHSCNPNTSYSSKTDDGYLEYKVIQPIKAGDMVTFSYLDKMWETPTHARRNQLLGTKSFLCQCERCSGPDFCRPLRCQMITCQGAVLVVSRDGKKEEWECNHCGPVGDTAPYRKREVEVKAMLDETEVSMMRNMAMVRPAQLKPLISKAAQKLHPVHYLTLRAMEMYARLCVSHAHQLESMLDSGMMPRAMLQGLLRQHGHPYKLRRESSDALISMALAMECIAAQCCCDACCSTCVNSDPEPQHFTVYDGCLIVFHAAQDILRTPAAERSGHSCRMIHRYIPDMRLMFGDDDSDIADIVRGVTFVPKTVVQETACSSRTTTSATMAQARSIPSSSTSMNKKGKKKGRMTNNKKKKGKK
jgi:SET domain